MKCPFDDTHNVACGEDFDLDGLRQHLHQYHNDGILLAWLVAAKLMEQELEKKSMELDNKVRKEIYGTADISKKVYGLGDKK